MIEFVTPYKEYQEDCLFRVTKVIYGHGIYNSKHKFDNLGIFQKLSCILLYCIVLKGWSLLPNALRPFQIYRAPPNLGIRTCICRLNFAQRPICFQA